MKKYSSENEIRPVEFLEPISVEEAESRIISMKLTVELLQAQLSKEFGEQKRAEIGDTWAYGAWKQSVLFKRAYTLAEMRYLENWIKVEKAKLYKNQDDATRLLYLLYQLSLKLNKASDISDSQKSANYQTIDLAQSYLRANGVEV